MGATTLTSCLSTPRRLCKARSAPFDACTDIEFTPPVEMHEELDLPAPVLFRKIYQYYSRFQHVEYNTRTVICNVAAPPAFLV